MIQYGAPMGSARQHFRLSICFDFYWAWQIQNQIQIQITNLMMRRAGLSTQYLRSIGWVGGGESFVNNKSWGKDPCKLSIIISFMFDELCGKLNMTSGQTITSRCLPVTSVTNISIVGDFSSKFLTWLTIGIFLETGGKCDCGVVLPLDASCR